MWIARESTGGGTFEEERARAKFGGFVAERANLWLRKTVAKLHQHL